MAPPVKPVAEGCVFLPNGFRIEGLAGLEDGGTDIGLANLAIGFIVYSSVKRNDVFPALYLGFALRKNDPRLIAGMVEGQARSIQSSEINVDLWLRLS